MLVIKQHYATPAELDLSRFLVVALYELNKYFSASF